jgi:hypothetical protein
MPHTLRPANLTIFAGSAWLLTAPLAMAGPATTPPPAAEAGPISQDAAPQLPPPAAVWSLVQP